MNAPNETDVAQATPRPQRGRGRGGRGGGTSRGGTTTGRVVAKPQPAKIGPNRLMETEWTKDSVLKGDSFVLFAGSGMTGDQQWTFHHPIGETSLDARDWVATPTRDIGFLLQRRDSEALMSWRRQAELAKRKAVLTDGNHGRTYGPDAKTEVWTFENAPAIQPTVRACMTAAKAAGAQESAWLSYADQAVRVSEQTFKEQMRNASVPDAWVENNPRPSHETKGGPLGDSPQRAVPYLKGLSTATAKDKVIRVAIGLDQTDADSSDESDEDDDDKPKAKPKDVKNGKGKKSPKPKEGSSFTEKYLSPPQVLPGRSSPPSSSKKG